MKMISTPHLSCMAYKYAKINFRQLDCPRVGHQQHQAPAVVAADTHNQQHQEPVFAAAYKVTVRRVHPYAKDSPCNTCGEQSVNQHMAAASSAENTVDDDKS